MKKFTKLIDDKGEEYFVIADDGLPEKWQPDSYYTNTANTTYLKFDVNWYNNIMDNANGVIYRPNV